MLHLPFNIKIIRALTGLNQTDFADKFRVSVAMQKSYEGGKAKPDDLYIHRLATFAGVSEEHLVHAKLTEKDISLMGDIVDIVKKVEENYEEYQKADPPPVDRTEDLINTLKEHNRVLRDVIEKNLDSLQTNLRTSQLLLRSIQTSQSAQHDVMIGSLERLEKRKKGSLAADADKLELELNLQLQGMDNRGDGDKTSNRKS